MALSRPVFDGYHSTAPQQGDGGVSRVPMHAAHSRSHGRYFARWLDEMGGVYHDHHVVAVPAIGSWDGSSVALRDRYQAALQRKRPVGISVVPLVPRRTLRTLPAEEHARTDQQPAGFVSQRALSAAIAGHKVPIRS